jgi:hypothetical protein
MMKNGFITVGKFDGTLTVSVQGSGRGAGIRNLWISADGSIKHYSPSGFDGSV